jgi:hypothetical protein
VNISAISPKLLLRAAQRLGPYLLIEAVLPGGTLVALLLYLYRRERLALVLDVPAPAKRHASVDTEPT